MRLLAEKRKREEALNNMRKFETIEEDDSEKKKGVRLFIGWTRMLAVFKGIYSEVVTDQKRRRSEQMQFFAKFIEIYKKVAKAWASRALRKPYIAIMGDREQPLRFDDHAMKSVGVFKDKDDEFRRRLMFTQVRIKGIIQDLFTDTTAEKLPEPLLLFLNGVTTPGTFVPDNWLTPFQLNRLDVDNYGAIIAIDENQTRMIAANFMFVRITLFEVLLQRMMKKMEKEAKRKEGEAEEKEDSQD